MKVTPEMADALYDCLAQDFGVEMTLEEAQVSLERALRDIPEPSHTVVELNKRITELQMRLERVREIAREWERAAECNRASSLRDDPHTIGVADTLMQCSGELEYELRQGES